MKCSDVCEDLTGWEDTAKHGCIDYWPSSANKTVVEHCLVIMLLLGKPQMRL